MIVTAASDTNVNKAGEEKFGQKIMKERENLWIRNFPLTLPIFCKFETSFPEIIKSFVSLSGLVLISVERT